MTRFTKGLTLLFVLSLFLCIHGPASAAYPTKPIELIVPVSAGGGSDIFARTLAKIAVDKKFTPQPIVVINKPGGSSAVGFSFVAQQKNNPYVLAVTNTTYYTVPLVGKSPVSYKDFQPISLLCFDARILVASKNAPFKTFKELLDHAKSSGKKLNVAGTGTLSEDALCFYAIKDFAKLNMDFVPFTGSGEVVTAVMGGHVDFGFLSISSGAAQIAAGELIPLVVAAGSRLPNYPDMPTLNDVGIPVTLAQPRGVIAPLGVDAEAVAFLEKMFQQVSETAEWKDYLNKNDLVPSYLNAADYGKETVKLSDTYEKYLKLVPSK